MTLSSQIPVKLTPKANAPGSQVLFWGMSGFALVFVCALAMWASFGSEIYVSMLSVVTACF
jgi:hypothetical protein